ncbi:MAG: ACT domain-containing protein [Candidatus Thermoplasmatota archaeon]|jgi:hypothetical protein|nr:ACT domain-containing protein [Candidatus Thermoplasmatota archaeon]
MERISSRVAEYLSSNPCTLHALQDGVVNYSSLARVVMKKLNTQKFNAVLAALKRYPEFNPSLESQYRGALIRSRLEAYYSIINITVRNSPENFQKTSEVYRQIFEKGGRIRVIQGSQGIVMITDKNNIGDIFEKFGSLDILSERYDLGELVIVSPLEIENLRGYVAYISSIISVNGINVYQIASFYNDITYIMDERFMTQAINIFSRLMEKSQA